MNDEMSSDACFSNTTLGCRDNFSMWHVAFRCPATVRKHALTSVFHWITSVSKCHHTDTYGPFRNRSFIIRIHKTSKSYVFHDTSTRFQIMPFNEWFQLSMWPKQRKFVFPWLNWNFQQYLRLFVAGHTHTPRKLHSYSILLYADLYIIFFNIERHSLVLFLLIKTQVTSSLLSSDLPLRW